MENKFEKVLWSVRYVVILAVILSIIAFKSGEIKDRTFKRLIIE